MTGTEHEATPASADHAPSVDRTPSAERAVSADHAASVERAPSTVHAASVEPAARASADHARSADHEPSAERAARASADHAPSADRTLSTLSAERAPSAERARSVDRAARVSSGVDGLSLTERRKAATRMEIARAAAGLFMRNGLRATRAEDIARAAGIAPRTFYRYFASKEESLGPLFAAGVEKWAETVRDAPADLSVPEALRHAVVATMTPGVAVRRESWEWVRSLLRLAEGSPALLRVWGEECQMAERTLAGVLAARISAAAGDAGRATGAPPAEAPASAGDTAARAGTSALVSRATSGDRPAPAGSPVPTGTLVASGSPATPAATSRRRASADRSIPASSQPPSSPEPPPALSPELRLSAAVAGAAVRVAVEAWAAGDAAADGPDGPVALAVRNLAALRDFPWSAERATT